MPRVEGTGVVAEFDEHAGLGWIDADDGRRLFVHCTQIADGSRRLPAGVRVSFEVVPGHLGRFEAVAVEVAS